MVKIITANTSKKQTKRVRTATQEAAQAELDATRAATAARRQDTRRKVVIGGALMALADRDPVATQMLEQLKANLTRPADKALFEGEDDNG
ncbi:hypothetical protein [Sulfitobacter donghicola]|uniref:Mobilization protein n=1 Tax=Sulfitobacter donghicola DSW-25 = KCTC 12864 = JCM 14565 TaxID=1300350 RepID=A0A073IBN9_9RHOB|nr:hypothetical protein [Sulfitobacter donghicola]KEJ87738.1 hypothetical protein DSW25_05380 [Sulfitobacter donghicola DSW-25 = KCTC 12864 = JCM 14565]KIN69857.1 hypothetical protein Z948_166 [Sulfitobacter donghicola DSW-25 = KCTC 12864 = JCM 14565]